MLNSGLGAELLMNANAKMYFSKQPSVTLAQQGVFHDKDTRTQGSYAAVRLFCSFDFILSDCPHLRRANRVELEAEVRDLSYSGGHPQSESWLTSEGVCSLTRGNLLLSVIPLIERS